MARLSAVPAEGSCCVKTAPSWMVGVYESRCLFECASRFAQWKWASIASEGAPQEQSSGRERLRVSVLEECECESPGTHADRGI